MAHDPDAPRSIPARQKGDREEARHSGRSDQQLRRGTRGPQVRGNTSVDDRGSGTLASAPPETSPRPTFATGNSPRRPLSWLEGA